MKKFFSLALALGLCVAANAQVEDANFAASLNLGSVLNGGSSTMVSGKYLLSDQLSLTAGFGISTDKTTDLNYDKAPWEDDKKVQSEDRSISNSFALQVGALYSFRPEKRVQPFVGANLSYIINNNASVDENVEGDKYYSKEAHPFNAFSAAAVFGVEYFFAKNISVSAAFDLGIVAGSKKEVSKLDYKDIDEDTKKWNNYKAKTSKEFAFATGQSVALNIYF